jgi:hypothetical protein
MKENWVLRKNSETRLSQPRLRNECKTPPALSGQGWDRALGIEKHRHHSSDSMDQAKFCHSNATTFHISLYKAGSQWIRLVLERCAPSQIIDPKADMTHVVNDPIVPGGIYPAIYLTKSAFDEVKKPLDSRHFVVLRDLRDTAVSAYFSLKFSHAEIGGIESMRKQLTGRKFEEAMLWILEHWLPVNAAILSSWIRGKEDSARRSAERDLEIVSDVLVNRCRGAPTLRSYLVPCCPQLG